MLLLSPNWASLVAQMAKNLPTVQETQVWSLSWEDPLEKGMEIHSNILAWKIPQSEEPGSLQSMGVTKESGTTEWLNDKSNSNTAGKM